jgi:hypothetical protein
VNAVGAGLFPAPLIFENEAYCFFVIGVTGCEPPVDFGPGVTPALLSSFCVAVLELPAAVEPIFGVAPEVGPLPASLADTAPFVGPLPASIFDCANAGAERQSATADARNVVPNEDMTISFDKGARQINPHLRRRVPGRPFTPATVDWFARSEPRRP